MLQSRERSVSCRAQRPAVAVPARVMVHARQDRLEGVRDVEGNSLMRVAAKTFHFETPKARIERVAQRRRWLRRTLKPKYALVPRLDGKPVGFLARLVG